MGAVLELQVDVRAPVEATWSGATDWRAQGEWMLQTQVDGPPTGQSGVGTELAAFTGVHVGALRLGFLDTMRVTRWDPPRRCDVLHTGRVVRGPGTFRVEPLPGGGSRFVWREELDLPLGVVGRLGWLLVRPLFAAGVRLSLRRFARWVEASSSNPQQPGAVDSRRGTVSGR